jgi:hypothetical protein
MIDDVLTRVQSDEVGMLSWPIKSCNLGNGKDNNTTVSITTADIRQLLCIT